MLNRLVTFGSVLILLCVGALYPSNSRPSTSEDIGTVMKFEWQEELRQIDLDNVQAYLPYITKYIDREGVSVPLVLAVMKAESNFQIDAKSRKGALGLMQLMPTTALAEYRRMGMDTSLKKMKQQLVYQPELNIALGVRHLEHLHDRLQGIENPDKYRQLVIASYNAGIYRVRRAFECKGFTCYKYKANRYGNKFFKKSIKALPAETRQYLKNVERYYELYKQALPEQWSSKDLSA